MKTRIFLILACLFVLAFPLAAQDFGLDLSNTTIYQYSDVWSLIQKDKVSFWFDLPLGQTVNLYLHGFYEFSGTFSDAETVIAPGRFDVGVSYFSFQPALTGSSLSISLGRIEVADTQSAVYSGLMDGFSLLFRKGNTRWSLGTGYLGLLNKNDALVLLDDDDSAIYTDDAIYFTNPRLLAMFGYAVDDLLKGFDLGFELWGQFDFNATTVTTNTLYYEPSFTYRPFASFAISGYGILSMLMDPSVRLGYSYGFEVSYKIPKALGLAMSLKLHTAGGNSETFDSYKSVKFTTVSTYTSGVIGDATSISAKISILPLSTMILAVDGGILLRDGTEVPAGYASGSESVFIGTELGAQVLWLMASDVVFMTGGGLFMPNRLGAYPADAPDEWTGLISLIIKM